MKAFDSAIRLFRKFSVIVWAVFTLYLVASEMWEFVRLPTEPVEVSLVEAVNLVKSGERPLIHLVDAEWNCDNLVTRHGKRWVTNIALQPTTENALVVAHFWGAHTCEFIRQQPVTGVLQPMGSGVYNDLKRHGMEFGAFATREHVFDLCTFCSRQYALSQVLQMLGILTLLGVIVGVAMLWEWRRWFIRSKAKLAESARSDNRTYIDKLRGHNK